MNFITKLKDNFLKLNQFLDENWLIWFGFLIFTSVYQLMHNINIYLKTDVYSHTHYQLFLMSFLSFILVMITKPNVFLFLMTYFISKMFSYDTFYIFQEWFFQIKLLEPLFKNIASKDINVIFVLFFILYDMFLLLNIAFLKIFKKRWDLKSIFTFMTISAYLIITFLFHYFLIEKNYRDAINNETKHLELIVNEKDINIFKTVCVNQNYICALSKDEIKEKIDNKEFSSFVDSVPDSNYVRGNFSFGSFENVYLIEKSENRWVVNKVFAKNQFKKTENYLMICLGVAHTFWYLFFIWLNLFHFRIGRRK